MNPYSPDEPQNKIRLVTAGSLYDGHDAAINVMRRILQATGAEVIHLGHNRSVQEIVAAAVQEDVQAVGLSPPMGSGTMSFSGTSLICCASKAPGTSKSLAAVAGRFCRMRSRNCRATTA